MSFPFKAKLSLRFHACGELNRTFMVVMSCDFFIYSFFHLVLSLCWCFLFFLSWREKVVQIEWEYIEHAFEFHDIWFDSHEK
jgi:hypothetical protein